MAITSAIVNLFKAQLVMPDRWTTRFVSTECSSVKDMIGTLAGWRVQGESANTPIDFFGERMTLAIVIERLCEWEKSGIRVNDGYEITVTTSSHATVMLVIR